MQAYFFCSKAQTPEEPGSNSKTNGIFELIDTDLVFDNESTNKNQDESHQNHALRPLYWN
jgi:hypothetical protein